MTNTFPVIPANMTALTSLTLEPTMSSREIAELTGKRHDNVIADIKKLLSDVNEDALKFEGIYMDAYNRQKKCYNLPKNLTYTLIAGYRADLRLKIVDRWIALEGGAKPAPKPRRVRKPSVASAFSQYMKIAAYLPLDENQRIMAAARGAFNTTGINPLEQMEMVSLPAPTNEHYFTPTELGSKRGVSGMRLNVSLAAAGLQRKEASGWVMTERGQDYGRIFDTTRRGGKGSQAQLKWKGSVLDLLK